MILPDLDGLPSLVRRDGITETRDDTARAFVATRADGTTAETLPYSDAENAAADARAARSLVLANAVTLRKRAAAALKTNRAFLALPSPVTNAQALAQIHALTRQNVALIRLVADVLDGTE